MRDKCPSKYNYYYFPHEKSFNLDLMLNKNLLIKEFSKLLMSENGASQLYKWSNTEGNWNLMMPRIKHKLLKRLTTFHADFMEWSTVLERTAAKLGCQLTAYLLQWCWSSLHTRLWGTLKHWLAAFISHMYTHTHLHTCLYTQWSGNETYQLTKV